MLMTRAQPACPLSQKPPRPFQLLQMVPLLLQMLQPQFKSHNLHEVLSKLFQIVPGEDPYRSQESPFCRRCAVVGNSGNLRGSSYGQDINGHDFVMR